MSGDAHPEIVIIRRGGHGDHDDHHGGVWKIAFADFMTAMMAFFLVMWLISANEKTRASVAHYFNPVRLVDATTLPRGLHESKKDESGATPPPASAADKKSEEAGKKGDEAGKASDNVKSKDETPPKAETPAGREKRLDTELQVNPYAALSEIAAEKGPGRLASQAAPVPREPSVGMKGGAHFRDPFAPPPPPPPAAPQASATTSTAASGQVAPLRGRAFDPDPDAKDAAAQAEPKAAVKTARDKMDSATEKQAAELEQAIKASAKSNGKENGPAVAVKRTKEGLLLSLTDTDDFAMFTNGSAVPSRKVVMMMEKVGALLKTRPGTIVLRGFTDNKPFRSGRYDNWRLSLDRAQVAHYMLVRGGLADARIAHIEGFADRGSKPGVEADSPLNRRIEILVKDEPT